MLGIIILDYNTVEDTKECINSIIKTTNCDYRIYVVDAGAADGMPIPPDEIDYEKVSLIRLDKNGGYSYGNNVGIKKAVEDGCEYILISNPDIVYYKNSIDHMYQTLINDSEIGVIGPSCKSLDREESQLLRKAYNDVLYLFSKKPLIYIQRILPFFRTEYPYPKKRKGIYKFKGMVRGCCFILSADLFSKMGYFDDNVFLYCEEWIIAKKLQKYNLYCGCDFESKVLHKEATSTNKVGNAFKTYHLYLSAYYYMKFYNHSSDFMLNLYYMQNKRVFKTRAEKNSSYKELLEKFNATQDRLKAADKIENCIIGK